MPAIALRLLIVGTLGLVLGVSLFAAACSAPDSDGDPATEAPEVAAIDVPPLLEVSIEDDQRAVQRGPELTGVLPQSFPDGLPLALPASVVDWGSDEQGSWVELLTSLSSAETRGRLADGARTAGWRVESSGTGLRVVRGGTAATLTLRDASPGTLYRVAY